MRARLSLTGGLTAVAGLVLLAWLIRRLGAEQIWSGVRQVGWGIVPIVAIGGLRFVLRAAAWRLCLEPPHRLPLATTFAAVVCGDALGNLTVFGPLLGEPAKAAFVRERVPLAPALTALAIENVAYTMSAAAMIAAGAATLLRHVDLPPALRDVSEAAVVGTVLLFAAALWLLWRQPSIVSRGVALVLRRGSQARAVQWIDRVRHVEAQVYSFASRHRGALPALAAAEAGFHALGVIEIYVTLRFLGVAPDSWSTAFLLETMNRLVTVVFKFVPLRLGVDEAATAVFTRVLGLGAPTGLMLALVRKARVLCWTLVGGLLVVRRGAGIAGSRRKADTTG